MTIEFIDFPGLFLTSLYALRVFVALVAVVGGIWFIKQSVGSTSDRGGGIAFLVVLLGLTLIMIGYLSLPPILIVSW